MTAESLFGFIVGDHLLGVPDLFVSLLAIYTLYRYIDMLIPLFIAVDVIA